MPKSLLPGAVADALDGHGGKRSESRGDLRDDRRAGRCDQFPFDIEFSPGNAAEDLGGGRRGQREDAVGALHIAVKGGHRTGDDLRPAEHLEADGRADDVDDRVHCAHLVEMDLFGGVPVHPAFGLREPPENPFRRLLYGIGEGGAADHLQDLLQAPVMLVMGVVEDHTDVRCLDVSGDLPADLDSVAAHAEGGEILPEPLRVRPCADERPERHVAADTRETVEIGDFHRFTRCAKYPAPKPLSMFMTATPAAQELSIASSAASPPKLAP